MTSLLNLAVTWIAFRLIYPLHKNLQLTPYVFKGFDSLAEKRVNDITTQISELNESKENNNISDKFMNSLLIIIHAAFIILDFNAIVYLMLFIFNY